MFRGSSLSPSAPPFRPLGARRGSSITMLSRRRSSPSIDARERTFVPYFFRHKPGTRPSRRRGSQGGFRWKYRTTRHAFLAEMADAVAVAFTAAANQYQSTMDTPQRNSAPCSGGVWPRKIAQGRRIVSMARSGVNDLNYEIRLRMPDGRIKTSNGQGMAHEFSRIVLEASRVCCEEVARLVVYSSDICTCLV